MKYLRIALTMVFGLLALYHLYLAFLPDVNDPAIGARHLLFIVINVVSCIILNLGSKRALYLLIPLTLYQVISLF